MAHKKETPLYREYLNSPVGYLEILCDETHLLSVSFVSQANKKVCPNSITMNTRTQLEEYFEGRRKQFDLPLRVEGTDFQKKVWSKLKRIPYGKLETYGSVAKSLGKPLASRAVGGANNKNKIGIIIPCHRVVGTSGSLTGYAPGLKYKEFLLKLEGSLEN
jgi:methylated-DNA-[protein]-cysteine S-methyltransferase